MTSDTCHMVDKRLQKAKAQLPGNRRILLRGGPCGLVSDQRGECVSCGRQDGQWAVGQLPPDTGAQRFAGHEFLATLMLQVHAMPLWVSAVMKGIHASSVAQEEVEAGEVSDGRHLVDSTPQGLEGGQSPTQGAAAARRSRLHCRFHPRDRS